MSVKISDNYFTEHEHRFIRNYCLDSQYSYGELDDAETPPSGLVHNIPETHDIYFLIASKIKECMGDEALKFHLYRMYVNCFAPSENPYFHTDGEEGDLTFLYYPNKKWEVNDGGETQIYHDDIIKGYPPIPNRMISFDASLLHKATCFRSTYRFTVAIKYTLVKK